MLQFACITTQVPCHFLCWFHAGIRYHTQSILSTTPCTP